jgi:transmembrane sensor
MTRPAERMRSRNELREEAADWFVLMRGPERDDRREAFEAWLQQKPAHREAYSRIAETFNLGQALRYEDLSPHPDETPNLVLAQRPRAMMATLVAAFALTMFALAWLVLRASADPWTGGSGAVPREISTPAIEPLLLVTNVGEIRPFELSDGSVATLDTDSVVTVRLDNSRRSMTLLKGRVRFAVAHEARPFVVAAGRGSVTAVGTVFDVALAEGGRVVVRLLKGAVDVDTGHEISRTRKIERLAPGETISFDDTRASGIGTIGGSADAKWPDGLRDFNGARLSDVLADASRYATMSLHADDDVADLPISGTFRVDNARQVAANAAEVLGLARIVRAGEITLVRACPDVPEKNCLPPP